MSSQLGFKTFDYLLILRYHLVKLAFVDEVSCLQLSRDAVRLSRDLIVFDTLVIKFLV